MSEFWDYQNTLENYLLLDVYTWQLDFIISSLYRAWSVSTVLYIDWKCPEAPYTESHHAYSCSKVCLGKQNLLQEESEVQSSPEDTASSDQEIDHEPDPEVSFHPSRAKQAIPNMFMPYIEGPKMDWTVNNAPYHRFLKWHLKCENLLECELVALPECQKCKKVIAWSGDFGMDQYVSWDLSNEDLNLDTFCGKYEEFCKPQTKEVSTHFYLLTHFGQGNRSMDEWYNVVQAQVNLAKYPPEMAKILHHNIFWFFLHDEEFVSKTINDSNVDLEKFPASKVRQLAKKMESSKAIAHHIRQVAVDPQGVQINSMRHQHTEISSGKHKKRKSFFKQKQLSHKNVVQENPQASSYNKKSFDPRNAHKNKDRCSKCGDSTHVEGFQCHAKKSQCKACHNFLTFY